jgi:hypothetical protein
VERLWLDVMNAAVRKTSGAKPALLHSSHALIKWIVWRLGEMVRLLEAWSETDSASSGTCRCKVLDG